MKHPAILPAHPAMTGGAAATYNTPIPLITPDSATLYDVAISAAARGLTLIERAGRIALCPAASIPPHWHRIAVRTKIAKQTAGKS